MNEYIGTRELEDATESPTKSTLLIVQLQQQNQQLQAEIERLKKQNNDDESLGKEDWDLLIDKIKNPKYNEKLAKLMSEPCPFDVDDKGSKIQQQLTIAKDTLNQYKDCTQEAYHVDKTAKQALEEIEELGK